MKLLITISAMLTIGCAQPGQRTMLDALVFSPTVDPASIRDPARYDQDRAECKALVMGVFTTSFPQQAMMYARCLSGRGYSVLGI